MMRFTTVLAACLMLSACASKNLHYRLTRINGVPAIAPPDYQDRTPSPDVRVRIPGVGARGADAANCNLSLKEFDLKARGRPRGRSLAHAIPGRCVLSGWLRSAPGLR